MKKTYTVTYCEWSSYGSVLQAIGLQKTIKSLGASNHIIKSHPLPKSELSLPKLTSFSPFLLARYVFNRIVFSQTAVRYKKI